MPTPRTRPGRSYSAHPARVEPLEGRVLLSAATSDPGLSAPLVPTPVRLGLADATPPVVTGVRMAGVAVPPGTRLVSTVPQATVAFSENLDTSGGPAGPNSATNPANWGLTVNGPDYSARVTAVAFGLNTTTGTYEAIVTFSPALSADGDYVLTARQSIRDLAGNTLDGDHNGSPGGDYALPFSVHRPVRLGSQYALHPATLQGDWPVAATDADGDSVVAWTTGQAVAARRLNAAGVPQGAAFQVSDAATTGEPPAVASDRAGDFVVAWISRATLQVMARRYDAAGLPLGGEFVVSSTTANRPAVAMDAGGDIVVTWSSFPAGAIDIYARRYDAAGQPVGGEFLVTPGAGYQNFSAAAMDAAGNFVVVWDDLTVRTGVEGTITARRFGADGQPQGGEFVVSTSTAANQLFPIAAMNTAGDLVVGWRVGFNPDTPPTVYARRYDAAGQPRGGEFRPPAYNGGSQFEISVGIDADGDTVAAWTEGGDKNGTHKGVYAQRYSAAGEAQGGEFKVNTATAGSPQYPAVAMDPGGDFVVAWKGNGATSGYGVYAQRYGANEAPTALGLPAVGAVENAAPAAVNLAVAFVDSTDAASALAYSVVGNTNPGLFASAPVGGGNLTLNLVLDAAGTATITVRATDTGGLSVDSTLAVTVRPAWLTVPSGGAWSIAGTPTNYTLSLASGNFVIPTDPATLNPNLNISVASPATLTVNADVHIAGLTLNGLGAGVTFNGPTTGGLSFTGGSVPLAVPVPGDDPVPPAPTPTPTPVPRDPPNLAIGDVTRVEGDAGVTTFSFPVTLDRASVSVVKVYYSTANVTAARGSDYAAGGGVLTFRPGETRKVVTVLVRGDTQVEADERFRVVLYQATGAVVADGTGMGTIRNDDTPSAPRVSAADARIVEGDKGTRAVAFDISLDRAAASVVTLKYATADGTARAGTDYLAAAGALVFRPGETRKRVTILVRGDKVREADETFFLDLHTPAGGTVRARGVIENDA